MINSFIARGITSTCKQNKVTNEWLILNNDNNKNNICYPIFFSNRTLLSENFVTIKLWQNLIDGIFLLLNWVPIAEITRQVPDLVATQIFIGEKLIPKQWTLSYFPFWKRLSKGRPCIASLMSFCQGCRIIIIQKFNNWLQLFRDQSLIWISLGHTD